MLLLIWIGCSRIWFLVGLSWKRCKGDGLLLPPPPPPASPPDQPRPVARLAALRRIAWGGTCEPPGNTWWADALVQPGWTWERDARRWRLGLEGGVGARGWGWARGALEVAAGRLPCVPPSLGSIAVTVGHVFGRSYGHMII